MTATPERPPASGTARASAVLGLVTRAADAHRRTDLESHLRRAGERLAGADVHVLIAGEFKQGKTSLVNALLNVRLPADPAIGSARPVVVSNGSEPTCRLVAPDGATTIDAAGAAAAITTPGPGHVELVVPRRALAGGLVVIDTPGAGGFNDPGAAAALEALSLADAVVLVSDAGRALTASELAFLAAARQLVPTVACALTRTDLHARWRATASVVAAQVAEVGEAAPVAPVIPVIGVSAHLRQDAVESQDPELNAASGYPELLAWLAAVVEGRRRVQAIAAAATATWAAEQLLAGLEGAAAPAATVDPHQWRQVLADRVGDLAADIDHDLRTRVRVLAASADQLVDAGDPADRWSEIEVRLVEGATQAMAATEARLRSSVADIVAEVSALAGLDAAIVGDLVGPSLGGDLGRGLPAARRPPLRSASLANQTLTALRGSYSGVAMVGMASQLAGLTLLGPVTIGAGIVLGTKSLREERARLVEARRAQARQAVRKYLDDLQFESAKHVRDALREVSRDLRDAFTGSAAAPSVAAAGPAAGDAPAPDAERLRALIAEGRRVLDDLAAGR